jgi:cell division protein FtsB
VGKAINPALSGALTLWRMVTRKRLRTILNALALYTLAALLIGYFFVNAYNGDRGLRAKEDIDRQTAAMTADLNRLKREHAQ